MTSNVNLFVDSFNDSFVDPFNDSIADPFIDFDEYVNGKWKKDTNIPDDQVDWGTFNILHEANIKRAADILDSFADENNNDNNKDNNKSIGLLFRSLLRTDSTHTDILRQSLHKYLLFIDDIRSIDDVGIVLGFLMMIDVKPFMNIIASEDPKNTEMVRMTMYHSQISLPEKEYYTDSKLNDYVDALNDSIKDVIKYVYKDMNTKIDINIIANDSITIEKSLASMFKPVEQRREQDKLYFTSTLNEFINSMLNPSETKTDLVLSNIKKLWENLFKMAMLDFAESIIVYDIEFFQQLSIMLVSTNLNKIKNYIKYVVVRDIGSRINHEIDIKLFNFFGKKLLGQIAMSDRTKIVVQYLNNTVLGEIIGEKYVSKHFDAESKIYVDQMIKCIKKQMNRSLKSLSWMTPSTKKQALLKLNNFKTKIGHPHTWTNHLLLNSQLIKYVTYNTVQSHQLIDAVCELKLYSFKVNVFDAIDQPSNNDKWHMNAHEVNACYDPQRNEIIFPAGILQPPFFDKNESIFKNYGFIGTVIGHEIIHGYDDQGRKFDHNGNTVNWWNESDFENFTLVADKIVKQYESYNINGRKINGQLTLGENIADIGGVNLAYKAVISNCIKKNIPYTLDDERDFFMSYAQVWRINTRPEKLLMKILSDPHSPNKYRIYALRNFDAFYKAFQTESQFNPTKISDTSDTSNTSNTNNIMYLHPDERIVMW